MRFAKGAHALGMCDRCGQRYPLNKLVPDGRVPTLRVHPSCRDIKPPQEEPFRTDEGIILKDPRPDRDDDSSGDTGELLVDALFPNEIVHGGGT